MSISTTAATLNYSVGYTCNIFTEDAGNSNYGKMGFDWVGDRILKEAHIGEMKYCCSDGGGDGQEGPGVYYSFCDPDNGCKEEGSEYTCSFYVNVTGKRPAPGRISGIAQAPMATMLKPANTSATAVSYANPWTGACKAATAGSYDEFNATLLASYTLHWNSPTSDPTYDFYNISGATCAPQCDPKGLCPTLNLPNGTTASPRCALSFNSQGGDHGFTACALMCDPTDPSGTGGATSKCPAGATCQQQYPEGRPARHGMFKTGVCTYAK